MASRPDAPVAADRPMIRQLEGKPDFDATIERFAAWWAGGGRDRPPVTLAIAPRSPAAGTPRVEATTGDAELAVERAVAALLRRDYAGDAFPALVPGAEPALAAALYGVERVEEPREWQRLLDASPDFGCPAWQALERITDLAIERSRGRFLVGLPSLYGSYDLLAALRGHEALCTDLLDHPALLRRVGEHVADGFVAGFRRLRTKLAAAGFGSTSWLPFYHEGPAHVLACDFWCLVSGRVAREAIVPGLLRELAPLERSLFHLDGPDALRHLDLLLELPELRAVQWVYGAGRGPARRWIETYRRVRASGRAVLVMARDARDALGVLEELGPRGVWLHVEEGFASLDDAERFLREVERSSRR
jgi:hypothetical protein